MYYRKNPVHIIWLIPFLLVSGAGIWLSLSKSQFKVDGILGVLVFAAMFASLLISFSIYYFRFMLVIDPEGLTVREATETYKFLYTDLRTIFIKQSPIDRLLGLKNIFIELKDRKKWERTRIEEFASWISGIMNSLPGRHGWMIIIPSVPALEADKIVNEIKSKGNISITEVGVKYHRNNLLVRLGIVSVYVIFAIMWGLLFLGFIQH